MARGGRRRDRRRIVHLCLLHVHQRTQVGRPAVCRAAGERKDAGDGLLYTRIVAISYRGQLLEIMFRNPRIPLER